MSTAATQYGIARADFDGDSAKNQISFKKDEVVLVMRQLEGGWWLGVRQKDGTRGYFPQTYIKIQPSVSQPAGGADTL